MRRAARRDSNETSLVEFLRQFGSCELINDAGIPDLIFGVSGFNILFEVKTEKGRLTPAQSKFFESWQGPAFVIKSINDIKDILLRYRFIREYECCGKFYALHTLIDPYEKYTCPICKGVLQYNKIVGVMEI